MNRANPFETATAYDLLAAVAARHGDREAMVLGAERVTFADFLARVDAFAAGLVALGLGRGDALGIWLPNRPRWFVAQYAAARLGIVVVALNPRYRAHELGYILGQSRRHRAAPHRPPGRRRLLRDPAPGGPRAGHGRPRRARQRGAAPPASRAGGRRGPLPRLPQHSPTSWTRANGAALPAPSIAPDDVFTLLYTSGTTSFPKGAMISHRNCVPHGWNTRAAAAAHRRGPRAPGPPGRRHVGRPQHSAVHVEPRRLRWCSWRRGIRCAR